MKNKRTLKSYLGTAVINLIPALYAVTCIFPVVWLFYTTFKTQPEFSIDVLALPKSFTNFTNYSYVLTQMPVVKAMFNTLRVTSLGSLRDRFARGDTSTGCIVINVG